MARLTPEILVYGLIAAGDADVAADGSRVAYVSGRANRETDQGTSQVWVSAVDGSEPTQLTWTGDRNREPRWSPDCSALAFVSDRVRGFSGLYVLPMSSPGEPREIARHRPAIGHLAWAPDGRRIAYTTLVDPENPGEAPLGEGRPPRIRVTRRLDYKQENRGFLNDTRLQVFVVDVLSGARRQLTHELNDILYPRWSPDGRTLAARVALDGGIFSAIALIDVETGAVRRVGHANGSVHVWSWSPDGSRLLFAGQDSPRLGDDLFVYHLQDGRLEHVAEDLPVAVDAGFPTILPPAQPVWLSDNQILFHGLRGGESGLYTFDLHTRDLQRESAGQTISSGFTTDRDHRFVVQAGASFTSAGELWLTDRQTRTLRPLTRLNTAQLTSTPPAQWEHVPMERDGVPLDAWLLKPADFDPSRRYPIVLDVHGGPHGFYGYAFNNMQQILASNGFLVLFSNPRGSGTYGREFAEMVRGDWGGEDYLDLMYLLDRIAERPYVDASRTGIWGYSYGGYMTAWAISQSDRFQAAVCGAPCFDLESMYGTSDISYAWGPLQWGGAPHEASEAFAAHSPSTFAHRTRTPTLILHGEADERCPIGQGEQMFVALKQAGCEVEFVRYPGGPHAMLRVSPPSYRADFLARLLGWFTNHLGSRESPARASDQYSPA